MAEVSEANMHEYWNNRWEQGATGWKRMEMSRPFNSNIGKVLAAPQCASHIRASTHEEWISGKRVLVPLCGDTFAARYFVDSGAALVVGVDLAEAAIKSMITQYFSPEDGFAVEVSQDAATSTASYAVRRVGGSPVAVLYVGDIARAPLRSHGGFDIVYDRASMVALPPSLRRMYAATIVDCVLPQSVVVLELVRRRNGPNQLLVGPPFHISEDTVAELYQSDAVSHFQLVPIDVGHAEAFMTSAPEEGSADFCFVLYAVLLTLAKPSL